MSKGRRTGPLPISIDGVVCGGRASGKVAVRSGGGRQNRRAGMQEVVLADWAGASLWDSHWVARRAGRASTAPSGWKGNSMQPGQGAIELGFPEPALGKIQGKAARRAGEPSGQREEPPREGHGGRDLLTEADARCPAGEGLGYHRLRIRRRRHWQVPDQPRQKHLGGFH